MSKTEKIWIFVFISIIALIYFFSPPLYLTIELTAKPQGVQEFYVVTSSRKFGLIHSGGSTRVDQRMIPVNQKVRIPLLRSKMNWFNPISVNFHHPEYFWEIKRTNNRYFMPKVQATPIAWVDVLANSPRWEIEVPSYQYGSEEHKKFSADLDAHRIVFFSHVQGHLNNMTRSNNKFLKVLKRNSAPDDYQKSIAVLEQIVMEFDKQLPEKINTLVEPSDFLLTYIQKQIDETHLALDEIHQTID